MVRQTGEQSTLFDLSAFSRPEKPSLGDWGWENESESPEPEIRRFQIGDRIQAKLPNSPEGIVVEIRQGKYPWSDTLLIEWDKGVPRKEKGTRSAISAGKSIWLQSYPTEFSIEESVPSGKTDEGQSYPTEFSIDESVPSGKTVHRFQLYDRVCHKVTGAVGTITDIIRVENLECDRCDRLSVRWDEDAIISTGRISPEPSDMVELLESTQKPQTADTGSESLGDRTPIPAVFPIEEKYGPVESWPDPEEGGLFDFLSYPTETDIDEQKSSGKTEENPENGDRTPDAPDEISDQWGFWINTASDWGEFYWRGNQPTIETPAQECVLLEDRGDLWLIVPVGKRPISQEGDGFANGCVKPYEIYKATLSPDPPSSLSYPTEMIARHEELTGKTENEELSNQALLQQIRKKTLAEKRGILRWLEWAIAEEELEQEPTLPAPKKGRQVVGEPVRTSKGYRRQELVRCGKATCKSCPHGPYWYEYWSEGGKRRSKYVGKNP